MSWFGRRAKAVAVPAPIPALLPTFLLGPLGTTFAEGVSCGTPECTATEGYQCAYVDASGDICTSWCSEHSVFSKGRRWCLRHANTVHWLSMYDGSVMEIGTVAGLNDRSPNLVGLLVDELNEDVTRLLTSTYAAQMTEVVTDASVRWSFTERTLLVDHCWARGWAVFSNSGYLRRVTLQATLSEPPQVRVLVDDLLLFKGVPDWIANRTTGATGELRAGFRMKLYDAISKGVKAGSGVRW